MGFTPLKIVIALVFLLSSCAVYREEIDNPTKPTSIRGWQAYESGSITIKAEFVLKKGESTNNGRIGLKLVDLFPSDYHFFDSPELPKVKVQFFLVSNQQVLCEGVFTRGGNALDVPHLCKSDLEWTVLYVRDVNYPEGWAFLDLR